jgi:hypothetical protein
LQRFLNEKALKSFFQTVGERDVPIEQLGKKLLEIAGRYRELLAQVRPNPDDGAKTAEIKNAASQALEAGQFDRADELLDQLQKAQDAELESRQLQRASTSAERGQLAMTRLQYRNAARYFAEAAKHLPAEHNEIRLSYLDREAGALYREGDERGDNEASAAAIEHYGVALTICCGGKVYRSPGPPPKTTLAMLSRRLGCGRMVRHVWSERL